MKYFPFTHDRYELTMNARAGVPFLIEVDADTYAADIALKSDILASDTPYYFQCPPPAAPLAWDAVALLLPRMAADYPQFFTLREDGPHWTWTNHLLNTATKFTLHKHATLPLPPLDWLARQVQEDLILMAPTPNGTDTVCAAGSLCFGSHWCLPDKIGHAFGPIHAHVPGFAEAIGQSSHGMMLGLKAGRPTARLNWTVSPTPRLNLAPALHKQWERDARAVTSENAGTHCFLRVERQTFSRLPRTGGILFTIRTYLTPFADIVTDPERLRLTRGVLRTMPPETRVYKGMSLYADALLAYLEKQTWI